MSSYSSKRLKSNGADCAFKVKEESKEETCVLGLDSFPPEILECILKATASIPCLTTCRLVSQSWNEASCRILQKEAAVPVNVQDELDMDRMKDLLLDRHSFFPPDWPSPFRNYKFFETSPSNPAFLRFIRRPNVRITTLEIIHDEDFPAGAFESLLERHRDSIVNLKIRANSDSVPFGPLKPETLEGGWNALKSVTLIDLCDESLQPCPHIDFLTKLSRGVRLEEMLLDGQLPNIAGIFKDNADCWEKLTKLALEYDKPPVDLTAEETAGYMKWTKEIKFPSLNSLVMFEYTDDEPDETSEIYAHCLVPLIQEFSGVLENLKVPLLPLKLIPSCLKLKHLCCALIDGDRIQDNTVERFPALTSLYSCIYWKHVPAYSCSNDENKQIVSFQAYWDDQTLGAGLETLWLSLRDFCPNLRTLNVEPKALSSRTLNVIRKRFPKLEDLHINAMSSDELLGTKITFEGVPTGWPLEEFEDCALLLMTGLTHLRLGKEVSVSREVILVLGRLPKITFLSFHWSSCLDSAQVSHSLGNVETVKIFYKNKVEKLLLEEMSSDMKSLSLERCVE